MHHRKIIHIDMDAFFASVEILDNPKLRGLPVIVGGPPTSRSVVSAASYKAREYGIHSAMSCAVAKRKCPHAIFIKPRFHRYKEIASVVHDIFREYTHVIETMSMDEAWLDVTENFKNIPSATLIAEEIRAKVKEKTGVTCSAGVSFNKFLSKIASDENKPDGICIISPDKAHDFLMELPLHKIPGVGKVMQQRLAHHNLRFGRELYACSQAYLAEHFGKMGLSLYRKVRGIDVNPVTTFRERKSMSIERTFDTDVLYGNQLLESLYGLVEGLWTRMQKEGIVGRALTLKVKFHDFEQITRAMSKKEPFRNKKEMYAKLHAKLRDVCFNEFPKRKIRLIGTGIAKYSPAKEIIQPELELVYWD